MTSDYDDHDLNSNESADEDKVEQPRPLTPAQQNLLDDITKHKLNKLKNQSLASHFRNLADSGKIYPAFTKPNTKFGDERFFQEKLKALYKEVSAEFQ